MTLRQLIRLNLKVIFGFLVLCYIFLLTPKFVNLEIQPKYDILPISGEFKKKPIKTKIVTSNLKIKEDKVSLEQKRRFLLRLVLAAFKNKHEVAISQNSYTKLCNYYSKWCKIIEVDEVSYKDKVYYTALTIYLLEFVNKYLSKLQSTLNYIKIQPEKLGRRGYAGHHSIVLNLKKNMGYKQFFEVLTHEMGHVVDLGVLVGDSFFKSSKFTEFGHKVFAINDPSLKFYKLSWLSEKMKKPDAFIEDFVSGYGMTDPFEDFAECFNTYLNHNFIFRQMAMESNILRQKYNFIAKLFKGNYINSGKDFNYTANYRPWDSTKGFDNR